MKRKSLGFTLLELLIVIVIIGILASLAIPRYQKTVESSNAAEAYSNLGTIRKAMWVYYSKTGNFVTGSAGGSDTPTDFSDLSLEDPNDIPTRKFTYQSLSLGANFPLLRAIRDSGPYIEDYIDMDANGNINEDYWLQ